MQVGLLLRSHHVARRPPRSYRRVMDELLWLKVWDLANTGVSAPDQAAQVCLAIVHAMSAGPRPA